MYYRQSGLCGVVLACIALVTGCWSAPHVSAHVDAGGKPIDPSHPVDWTSHGKSLTFTSLAPLGPNEYELQASYQCDGPMLELNVDSIEARNSQVFPVECHPYGVHSHFVDGKCYGSFGLRIRTRLPSENWLQSVSGQLDDSQEKHVAYGPYPADHIQGVQVVPDDHVMAMEMHDLAVSSAPGTCLRIRGDGPVLPAPGNGKGYIILRAYELVRQGGAELRSLPIAVSVVDSAGHSWKLEGLGEFDQTSTAAPYLGLQLSDLTDAGRKTTGLLGGVKVTRIDPTGPAQAAGIHEGDVVTQVGPVDVRQLSGYEAGRDFFSALLKCRYDVPISLKVYRHGRRLDLTIVPTRNPLYGDITKAGSQVWERLEMKVGLKHPLVPRMQTYVSLDPIPEGLKLSQVRITYYTRTEPTRTVEFTLHNVRLPTTGRPGSAGRGN
jgi:hypothetical protein